MLKNKGINEIKYCEYHSYYPFRFETPLSYEEICNRIIASPLVLCPQHTEQLNNALALTAEEFCNDFNNEAPIENFSIRPLTEHDSSAPITELLPDDICIETEIVGDKVRTRLSSYEIRYHEQISEQSNYEFQESLRIYGDTFTKTQERIFLLPMQIELYNGTKVWLTARLFIFSNKYAILKLELPLYNVSTGPFRANDIDPYVSEIINRWNIPGMNVDIPYSDLAAEYLDCLCKMININLTGYENKLDHIIMIDYDNIPAKVTNFHEDTLYDLYSIICAPIPPNKETYFKDLAMDYVNLNQWTPGNVKYLLKTTGGCLSTIDRNTIQNFAKKVDFNYNDPDSNINDILLFYNCLANNIRVASEFVLTVLVLKKTLLSASYDLKAALPKQLLKIRKHYNENVRYLCEIQEYCFGSVSEQLKIFERHMPYYFKTELNEKKMKAIDDILDQQENQRRLKFNDFIATSGIVIASILGLPAIHETLTLLNDMFIKSNIPLISVNNMSFIFWISLIITISIIYIKYKRS